MSEPSYARTAAGCWRRCCEMLQKLAECCRRHCEERLRRTDDLLDPEFLGRAEWRTQLVQPLRDLMARRRRRRVQATANQSRIDTDIGCLSQVTEPRGLT